MIRASIGMLIPLAKQKEAVHILELVDEKAKIEKGCISSHIYRGVEDRRLLRYEQCWESEEDMNRHLRSDDYQKVLLVMEMAAAEPEVRFDRINATCGLEAIEVARKIDL